MPAKRLGMIPLFQRSRTTALFETLASGLGVSPSRTVAADCQKEIDAATRGTLEERDNARAIRPPA